MENRRTNKKKTTESKAKKKGRKPVRQIIVRLLILLVVTAGILAYGSYLYGWQVLGEKTPRMLQKGPVRTEVEDKKLLDDKIKSVIDKVKQEAEQTPEPEMEMATPEPVKEEPTPEPKKEEKSDQEQLKDFLDSKLK